MDIQSIQPTAHSFTSELKGPLYHKLLEVSLDNCATALLVVRPELELSSQAMSVLESLAPFLIKKEISNSWPGTTLYGNSAQVHSYQLNGQTVQTLEAAADALYSWTQPALPEDLCLLRSGGEPWLVTISHERDSYISLRPEEFAQLNLVAPELAQLLDNPTKENQTT